MKIVICIVFLIFLEEICNYIFKRTKWYGRYLKDVKKFVEGVPENIEIACVGSGPGYHGISFEDSPITGFNFCTAPQNFEYAYKILQQYKGNLKNGCIVIIAIMCPMSFGKNYSVKNKSYSDKYYYFLDKKYVENYSMVKHFFLKRPLVVWMAQIIKVAWRRVFKFKKDNNISNTVVDGWIRQFHLKDLKEPTQAVAHEQCFRDKRELLCEEISFLKENLFRPILVIPPIPKMTRDEISEDFIQAFSKDNISIVAEKMDIPVLNYYADERITQDMFCNDIFVNEKGRKVFSEILIRDVMQVVNKENSNVR